MGIISVDSDAIYSVFVKYLKKKWEHNEAVHQLFIDFKKASDSVRREVLYNILIEFGIPKKLLRIIKMCPLHHPANNATISRSFVKCCKWLSRFPSLRAAKFTLNIKNVSIFKFLPQRK